MGAETQCSISLKRFSLKEPLRAIADGAPQSTLQHSVLSISHTNTVFPFLSVCLFPVPISG